MFPTKHPSSFGFLLQGRFWVMQQWGSSCLLQGREGRKCPGGQVPVWRAWPADSRGAMATSTCPHCHCLTSGHSRGSKMGSGAGGRDVTWPPAEMKPHCPPWLWSELQIPGGRAGGGNCPTWNHDGEGGRCLWKVQRRCQNKLLLGVRDGAVLFLFFKCGHG